MRTEHRPPCGVAQTSSHEHACRAQSIRRALRHRPDIPNSDQGCARSCVHQTNVGRNGATPVGFGGPGGRFDAPLATPPRTDTLCSARAWAQQVHQRLPEHKSKSPLTRRGDLLWRSRWDLNPRCAFTHTTFRELHLRPLGHGTEDEFTRGHRVGANRGHNSRHCRCAPVK